MAGNDNDKAQQLKADVLEKGRKLEALLKESKERETQEAALAFKDKLNRQRQESLAQYQMDFAKKGMIQDGSGRELTLKQDADNKLHHALSEGMASYNDWRSAMMSLIQIYSAWTAANDFEFKEKILLPLRNNYLMPVLYNLKDSVTDMFKKNKDIEIPMLEHFVTLGDDGKLNVELTRTDAGKTNQESKDDAGNAFSIDSLFKDAVVAWLEQNHYKPDATDPSKFINTKNDKPLDKQDFAILKKDSKKGLGHFLKDYNADLEFINRLGEEADNTPPSPRP